MPGQAGSGFRRVGNHRNSGIGRSPAVCLDHSKGPETDLSAGTASPLGELVRCAWRTLQEYCTAGLGTKVMGGAVFSIQTYGDQLNFHPHLHSLVSDVVWDGDNNTFSIGWPDSSVLTKLFQHQVLEMLIRFTLLG